MREIKFRIWDGNNNHYVYPDVIELGRGLEYEQYTGLKDKNGVEIYEGDVIGYFYHGEPRINGIVEFDVGEYAVLDDSGCGYPIACGGWEYDDGSMLLTKEEVIGNIHENPELLEKDNG